MKGHIYECNLIYNTYFLTPNAYNVYIQLRLYWMQPLVLASADSVSGLTIQLS